ncbi:cellulose synthase-like protein E6 isoform X2 [Mercurialis annua]|nr:cellulose synthase-like protein E6 isoform X2 [Mercurialis annua]XP_055960865.1 cellulose synthase-like protein E6 isoform X2 [Mercurialis annua]
MNTVLAAVSYNYPTEKLAVYLSDDGGSELTFYAMLEAAEFAKYWVPFCKRYNIKPLSPEAYFAQSSNEQDITFAQELSLVKKLYNEMKDRINSMVERGSVPRNIRDQHKGFLEWNNNVTKKDHQAIVQIVVDGRDETNVDNNGCQMPTLVYLAREKNSQYPHHFKAGAMNALIRVSSIISNGSVILNLDCDMYANEPDTILEALCFFMDEQKGHEIAFVQHSQAFNNITKNDLYGNSYNVTHKVELNGMGGYGASPYCGTGCFHRRQTLCGQKFSMHNKLELKIETKMKQERTSYELEEAAKLVATCIYEQDTLWGKEMGLVYGCSVEDMITGLTIQCRGWKSIYYSPKRDAFLGIAPTTLEVHLIQHKRWSEGMFQIFLSKYCPFIYGYGKLKLGAKLGYCVYLLWPPLSLPTLYYVIVPPLCLLRGIPLFPQVSSRWFIPFAYVFLSTNVYSMVEESFCGDTIRAWWNLQRSLMIRRTTVYFFAFIDTIIKQLGLSQTTFLVTPKTNTEDVSKRYEQEIIEFGSSSVVFTIVATLAMLNIFSLIGGIIIKIVISFDLDFQAIDMLIPQVGLCVVVVMLNFPAYHAMFFRHDRGRLPPDVTIKSIIFASCICFMVMMN